VTARPFKDWVAVPITEATRWPGLAERVLHAALG
jgi:hypothetical protein